MSMIITENKTGSARGKYMRYFTCPKNVLT